ncbi:hypothetical protein HRR83_006080 [Exophiala dermatitidis]|uniref:Zn(2)-C6 fungal-type domain-containing protein n=2 Tax=Exophiala dermatitidis TaxID=5970 RepID=H6BMQ2_EXODN|nr:uncharacterized protein HMPREF1120_01279 [Exophiala dermatitidis NIH/UT8656]KAJ4515012.1 hypothetical protein HRR74_005477 [Exophiala dermatitidis]EHY53079.1 hypothetical protein HMPREF1120_01279 [Exophiala dermatitidis NIH/UT8656]KAJ4517503.1 hypothetical protein HRR73_004555 [Exophiala dermatitidis]KAJ4548743.1 hypothetical protein HRR76_001324 [Exophiala dermatitidis]KAJ4552539.1 hypothetical protein HRR77_002546 [Exophiala dermatitidis]
MAMSQPKKTGREKGERRYSSIACLECRKRKVKCNNDRPRCSNCSLYQVECIYGEDRRRASEGRRKPSVTRGELAHNINHAEVTIDEPSVTVESGSASIWDDFALGRLPGQQQDGADIDFTAPSLAFSFSQQEWDPSADDSVALTGLEGGLGVDQYQSISFFPDTSFDPREQQECVSQEVFAETPDTSTTSQGFSPTGANIIESHSVDPVVAPTGAATKLSRTRSQDELATTVSDMTKQLTSRLGRLQIAEDGLPRYYGATSNLHILHSGPNSLVQPNIRHVLTHGDAAISQAGLVWQGDLAYENHLTNLFFSWHNTLMHVLDKSIFLRARRQFKQGQMTDLYSPALENAVFCVGSAYTDRSHPAIKEAADEFFAFRTKAYLEIEMDSPTIATAQAVLILSSHEAAHARESRGWIYSGMAVQIMTDLGLHLDLGKEYSRLDRRESESDDVSILRRNLFWSTNTIDTLWSAHIGRPSLMKRLAHNVQCPLPSPTYNWEYYTDEYSTRKFPPDFNSRAAAYVHIYLASLMTILARISDALYSGVPELSRDTEKFVADADADFEEWLSSLPQDLRLDASDSESFHLPAVLELHMSYHECIILLHRPLMSSKDIRTDMVPTPANSSLQKCVKSAEEICRILVMFRKMYGLRRPHHHMVHVTMTAALIHIFQLCAWSAGTEQNKEAQTNLLTCIQALGEMGQTYKSASRALDVVTSLRQSWQNDAFAGDRFKKARLG